MPKKITYEQIKKYIESFNYKLLSIEFISVKNKIEFQCPEGHKYYTAYKNFQQGSRCPICNTLSKKFNINDLKKQTKFTGYKLLSTKYIDIHTKLKFQCDNNHIFYMTWNDFKYGNRCAECAGLKRKTYKEVKEYIESFNYKLLSTKYISAHKYLKVQCNKGHIYKVKWAKFQQGRRCPRCHYKLFYNDYTEEELLKLKSYRIHITNLSNINYIKYKNIINPENLVRGRNKYHLDHNFSILEGFRRNIKPKIIANPYNLQMLSEKENIAKRDSCWVTEAQLDKDYIEFIKTLRG